MSPQATIVLNHLRREGSITNVEAHAVHKVRSVSRRITELRDAGYGIAKEHKTDSTGQRYVRYVFAPVTAQLAYNVDVLISGTRPLLSRV